MKLQLSIPAVTVATRPGQKRSGAVHTYHLNGTLLHDVLVNGRWVTTRVEAPLSSAA